MYRTFTDNPDEFHDHFYEIPFLERGSIIQPVFLQTYDNDCIYPLVRFFSHLCKNKLFLTKENQNFTFLIMVRSKSQVKN